MKSLSQKVEEKMNSFLDRAKPFLIAGSLGGLSLFAVYDLINLPERAINFPQPNAQVVSYDFTYQPTKGDVTRISRPENADSTVNADGSVTYSGVIPYCIKPQGKFTPQPEHTDGSGYTPENNDYWCDARHGTVTIRGGSQ